MRELFILIIIVSALIFLAPMIVSLVIFLLCLAAILVLLARFGLLPGFQSVRYVGGARKNKASWKWKWKYPGRGSGDARGDSASRNEAGRDSGGGWYQTSQEGEEITLPETALRKEDEKKTKDN